MTIEQTYKEYVRQLSTIYDEREADNIADWVFENITSLKKSGRISGKKDQLNNGLKEKLDNALAQLLQHKPVQYVLSEAWFYKMKLFVNEHVLIPRPETEELVEWAIEAKTKKEKVKIIDVGTGSGCIAIALKKEFVNADILGIDFSNEALLVAKQNAAAQNVSIDFLKIDFLEENTWPELSSFDIIVSNPPYIPATKKAELAKNVTAFEPHLALFVSDDDPFIFYKKIAKFAVDHLKANGKIYVEVHENYAPNVVAIFSLYNFTSTIKKDIYGKERMICAER